MSEEPTGTILDALADLELAAEQEYEALLKFVKRVEAYKRLEEHSQNLGFFVQPLPFSLVDGTWPKTVTTTVEVSVPSVREIPPSDFTERILALLGQSGDMVRSSILGRFGGTQYQPASEALGALVKSGRVHSWRSGKGTWYRLQGEAE